MDELFSSSAERSVIGGLMIDGDAYYRITLSESDFAVEAHRAIWRAIAGLKEEGQPTDPVTVSDRLDAWGLGKVSGGITYCGTLANEVPSAANIRGYADIIRDHAMRRAVMSATTQMQEAARDRSRGIVDVVDSAQREVLALTSSGRAGGLAPVSDYLQRFLDDTERRFEAGDGLVGVATGHADVDKMIHGFEGGDFVVVAGRPSMGKTILGLQWGERIAESEQGATAFFSVEMPAEQLIRRQTASRGRISLETLRTGNLTDADWPKLTTAVSGLNFLPFHIDDTPNLTVAELRSRARKMHQQTPLAAIVIDYLQLLRAGELARRDADSTTEIAEISKALKGLAKELDVPVIALAQLNRSLEQRPDKRPVMSDLRQSGQIEQDADVIAFLYRDEVYNPDTPHYGIAELIIRKQRNGPTGTVRMAFSGDYQRFDDLAPEEYERASKEPMKQGKTRGVPGYDFAAGEA